MFNKNVLPTARNGLGNLDFVGQYSTDRCRPGHQMASIQEKIILGLFPPFGVVFPLTTTAKITFFCKWCTKHAILHIKRAGGHFILIGLRENTGASLTVTINYPWPAKSRDSSPYAIFPDAKPSTP